MSCPSLEYITKIDLIQSLDEQVVVNSVYAKRDTVWSVPIATNVALDTIDWWETYIAPRLTTSTQLELVRVTQLDDPDGFIIEENSGLPINGTVALEPEPSNVSVVVSFRSGLRGRRNRGRNFLGGIPQAAIATNNVDDTYMGQLVAAYEALNSDVFIPNDAYHVIYSCRDIGGEDLSGVGVVVTSYLVNPIVATQRRRLPGRGS